uniref:Uncharacterized protein n=1 Tax=Triticum urartu TaxID=4572 RepID=A0A8R7QPK6_TRIUA
MNIFVYLSLAQYGSELDPSSCWHRSWKSRSFRRPAVHPRREIVGRLCLTGP